MYCMAQGVDTQYTSAGFEKISSLDKQGGMHANVKKKLVAIN